VAVNLVSRDLAGAASRAAAGLLAPSIEGGSGAAHEFALVARDVFPAFLEGLQARVGRHVEFSREGILDVAVDDAAEQRVRQLAAERHVPLLAPNEIAALEPALAVTRCGVLAEQDGYVDNVALMDALEAATRSAGPKLREIDALVRRIALERDSATLVLELGDRVGSSAVVLAAGAWSAQVGGIPRALPLRPLKGQMIRYDRSSLSVGLKRPVYGAGVYVVPRASAGTLVGATSEETGFDTALTPAAATDLATGAKRLMPGLASLEPVSQWSGLRPMTHDSLPILGTDPEFPSLIYSCGHSRNGILKAPLTGEVVASLFVGEQVVQDLSPFSPVRHDTASIAPVSA
jgi:glycine oxidase